MVLGRCWRVATRRWHYEPTPDGCDSRTLQLSRRSRKRRQLSAFVVGLSGALGIAVWMISIEISQLAAGPAALVSFLLAIIASALSAICYAEFVSRLKSCGSAFSFVYYSVGEFPAFVVGWTLVMDYTIGAAVAARSFSHHLDTFFDGLFSGAFRDFASMSVDTLADYFDFISVAIVLVLGCIMVITNRSTFIMSGIFTCIGLVSVLVIIIAGSIKADTNNWEISIHNSTGDCSLTFPYCCMGALRGAAPGLYVLAAAVGAVGGAPNGTDPRASVRGGSIALIVISFLLSGVIAVVSLSQPNYLLNSTRPISELFNLSMWDVFGIIVNIGGMLSILGSIFPAIFISSRILSDMARDKLMPLILVESKKSHDVSSLSKIVSIIITVCFSGLFDLNTLLSMISVGIILAYMACSVGIIMLRYEKSEKSPINDIRHPNSNEFCGGFLNWTKLSKTTRSTAFTANFVNLLTIIYCLSCVMFAASVLYMSINEIVTIAFVSVSGTICLLCVILIASQPSKVNIGGRFIVPLVPLLPCFNILLLVFIANALDVMAWIRFGIWLAFGLLIYFICLYKYDRGAKNLELIDKKVQNNGHIKGNLNRAFSISNENKISIATTTSKENNVVSFTTEALSPRHSDSGETNGIILKPGLSKTLADHDLIVSEEDLLQNLDSDSIKSYSSVIITCDPVPKRATEKVTDSDETSIIEMFEQMLATVDAPNEINEKNDERIVGSTKTDDSAKFDDTDDGVDDASDKFKNDSSISSYKLTEYNVVALVHREDKRHSVNTDDSKSFSSQFHEQEIETDEKNNAYTYSVLTADESEQKIESHLVEDQISTRDVGQIASVIPTPPPMDEEYFAKSSYKSTVSSKVRTPLSIAPPAEENPNVQRLSNASDDNNYDPIFGSKHQNRFMDRLNSLLQNQVMVQPTESQTMKLNRSYSLDQVANFSKTHKPHLLESLSREIVGDSHDESQEGDLEGDREIRRRKSSSVVLSKDEIKSKLESIFSTSGNFLLGPKHASKKGESKDSNDNVQEADNSNYKDDHVSARDIKKLENLSKLDTLQRQRAKFGDVLNSFRLSRVIKDPDDDPENISNDHTEMSTTNTENNHNSAHF